MHVWWIKQSMTKETVPQLICIESLREVKSSMCAISVVVFHLAINTQSVAVFSLTLTWSLLYLTN